MRVYHESDLDVEEIYYELSNSERHQMFKLVSQYEDTDHLFRVRNLEDQLKVEALKELFKKKTLEELQDIVNNR